MHFVPRTSLAAALMVPLMGLSLALSPQDGAPQSTMQDQSLGIPLKGPAPVDVFHPGRNQSGTPLYGGRVIVHSASLPKHMNYVTENSAYTRRMLREVHETLLVQDWEEHEMRPRLAKAWNTEAMLVLKEGAAGGFPMTTEVRVANPSQVEGAPEQVLAHVLYGRVQDAGSNWLVEATSVGHPLGDGGSLKVPKSAVDRIEKGAVFNFELRTGILWHPSEGHPAGSQILDVQDVEFSWSIYANSHVNCDEKRFQFEKVTRCEVIDDLRLRFFYEAQYAFAESTIGDSMTILPSHVYNLADPDNLAYNDDFTPEEQAEVINHSPHNALWIGLGPYRVVEWNDSFVEAVRFTDEAGKSLYFDEQNAGFVDTIRWRVIDDDETAMNALLNGELDFFERIKSEDYFGARTASADFTKNFYKGFKYGGSYGYTGWNMLRPQLKDLSVRKAIELSFDMEKYRLTNYKGLANRITGPFPFGAAAYNHDVKPRGVDVDAAIDLLDDAGWYDRDFDGVRDKNGVPLSITFSYPSGNDASKNFGLALQEALTELEIELKLEQLEWATFLDRIKKREFDACNLAWVPELESDPEQLWHSKWGAPDKESSNNSAVMDPIVDKLIAKGQKELDYGKRQEIWRELHAYLYEEVVPYLFMYNVPRKFAMNRKLRGFQVVAIDPGYVIRRWHYIDQSVAGTRKTLNR
jgi:peptide/nickel transport system substrate-binding protein